MAQPYARKRARRFLSAGQATVWGAMDVAAIQVQARPAARMTKGQYPTCTLFGARQPCLFMVSIP